MEAAQSDVRGRDIAVMVRIFESISTAGVANCKIAKMTVLC